MTESKNKKSILIIEDDMDLSANVMQFFKSYGFRVDMAASPQDGIKCVSTFLPSTVLLDIYLKNGSGIQFLEHLIKLNLSEIPKIFVTTGTTGGLVFFSPENHLKQMVAGFIKKPYDLQELKLKILSEF